MSGDLIDTTEMYLRTIYELDEEGVVPLRARIAERLHQSGPTVSQTVARMERDGLLRVADDRHLELTEVGQAYATRVMRKHRLAERLLTDVIGLDWSLVHDEACRWEHVISDDVERRLVEILEQPSSSPYGNPIPGLVELGVAQPDAGQADSGDLLALSDVVDDDSPALSVTVLRITEPLQADHGVMRALLAVGATPGGLVEARPAGSFVVLARGTGSARLTRPQAAHVYVQTAM